MYADVFKTTVNGGDLWRVWGIYLSLRPKMLHRWRTVKDFLLNFDLWPMASLDLFPWSSLPDVKVEESQHTWQRDADLAENHSPLRTASSYSLADLLALYGSTGDRQQQQPPLSLPAPLGDSHLSTAAGEQDGTPGSADWILPSKKKRNFSLGVAGMCCNQGCTKNDIGRLCWGRKQGGWVMARARSWSHYDEQ